MEKHHILVCNHGGSNDTYKLIKKTAGGGIRQLPYMMSAKFLDF